MKTKLVTLIALLVLSITAFAVSSEDVVGVWLTENKEVKLEIKNVGGKYEGNVVWLKYPTHFKPKDANMVPGTERLDYLNKENPKRKLMGLKMIYDFVYDDGEWEDGKIYNPGDGKVYYCSMEIDKTGKLKVRGSIDPWGLAGSSQFWTRDTK